ncbi:MAG: hypothetical protein IH585_00795 [Anaerolineaceae bacterium]|nr:hypothetical protein [Anaerolineaceae bacterium]
MSGQQNPTNQTEFSLALFRNAYLSHSLIQLRMDLETESPLDQLIIPADELLFRFLVAIELTIETINQILGTEYPFS